MTGAAQCEYCGKEAEGVAFGPVQHDGTRQSVLACAEHGDRAARLLASLSKEPNDQKAKVP